MSKLDPRLESKLTAFASLLLNQLQARVIVPPQLPGSGHWFGGGNLTRDRAGNLILIGRYRNRGDSRTGLAAGERGCELSLFRSGDHGQSWTKILRFLKTDLQQPGRPVLSIEGSALHWTPHGIELFVSSEKEGIKYPPGLESHLKPGCGVWTIDRLAAESLEKLPQAAIETVIQSRDPEHLHVKDPRVYDAGDGRLVLMFCTHPYCWSSSNTAFAVRPAGAPGFEAPRFNLFPRGTTWDVAMTRGTCLVNVPPTGPFTHLRVTLVLYDGGECVRELEQHVTAVRRPRGYSCEELGGVAYFLDGDFTRIHRLTTTAPLGISPHGTGCSRYVDVLQTEEGYYVTWQQSQADQSQPLVMNFVSTAEASACLA
jgi:hypothetical protein